MIAPQAVIDQAREWVGVKFLHQGRTRFGADCLGFIAALMAELGSRGFLDNLPHNYARDPNALLLERLPDVSRQIELQPAALLLIQFPRAKLPSHAGIFTGKSIIHCYQIEGEVVEHTYGEPWIARTKSIWALPLVTYQ